MDESQEKSYLSYLSFLPFRYDSITGFFVSLVMFVILNIPGVILLMIGHALSSFGGRGMWFWEDFWSLFGIIIMIIILYLPIIMFKNKSKSYNIYSIIFVFLFY